MPKGFLVFQGGGAKGILHIGALKAIEEVRFGKSNDRFQIKGCAGSSIGALVAALVAVGYKSSELVDSEGNVPIAKEIGIDHFSGIIGKRNWLKMKALRALLKFVQTSRLVFWAFAFLLFSHLAFVSLLIGFGLKLTAAVWLSFGAVIFIIMLFVRDSARFNSMFGMSSVFSTIFVIPVLALSGLLLLIATGLSFQVVKQNYILFVSLIPIVFVASAVLGAASLIWFLAGGFCHTDDVIKVLNTIFARKLAKNAEEFDAFEKNGLRFRDLNKSVKLRIVATDVTTKNAKLFSELTTPDELVANAVAASMALPLVFRTVVLGDCQFMDGGLVSNLPAWTFNHERQLDPDSLVLAFQIVMGGGASDSSTKPSAFGRLLNILEATMIGAQNLQETGPGRRTTVTFRTDIRLLDFDMSFARLAQAVENGRANSTYANELTKIKGDKTLLKETIRNWR